eukprot:403280_1
MSQMLDSKMAVMDAALNTFYTALGRNDYYSNGMGKFAHFCLVNGIEADDIEDELKENVDNCLLVDFDKSFPFPNSTTFTHQKEKLGKILQILQYCYTYQVSPQVDAKMTIIRS